MNDYRDTLVTSSAEGEALLKRHIAANRIFCNPEYRSSANQFYCRERNDDKASLMVLAGYDTNKYPDDFTILQFNALGELKGKKLGAVMLKGVLGTAYDTGAPAIYISHPINDGPAFWPRMGALPLIKPFHLADEIETALRRNTPALTKIEQAEIEEILEVAKRHPWCGFRLLARCEIELPDKTPFRDPILARVYEYQDMVIIPSEPGTRAMLEERLGKIPDFPPLSPERIWLKKIVAAVAGNADFTAASAYSGAVNPILASPAP